MKITMITALIFASLYFVLTHGNAEDHYIYKDAQGGLVLSNQKPPAGSTILRKLDLSEFREAQNATGPGEQQRAFNKQVRRLAAQAGSKEINL